MSNFSAQAFAGTAGYYVRYRLPYPEALLRDLANRARLAGTSRLLDLACGPGRVTLPLAARVREAWGVDLEPEMIEAARREAAGRGVTNVTWSVGRAEDFRARAGLLDLVTISDAFHRVDQEAVSGLALGWLRPGGAIAILGSGGCWSGPMPWQGVVADVIRRFAGEAAAPREQGPVSLNRFIGLCERILADTGFVEVASHEFLQVHEWSADEIVGQLFSTSICSRRVLGPRAEAFAETLKAELLAHDPSGCYRQDARFGYTFGRKPAASDQPARG